MIRSLPLHALLATTSLALPHEPAATPSDDPDTAPFGFADFEIYEIGDGTADLVAGDVNGDERTDLAVIHNARSRIELLLRRSPDAPPRAATPDDDPNPVTYDGRYDVRRLAVERRVLALEFADVDADGRDEVAWVAQGGTVHVVGLADEKEARPRFEHERKVDELARGVDELTVTDVDADGREELLLAGGGTVLRIGATEAGLEPPETIDLVDDRIDELFVADLDGDDRDDLLYVHTGRAYPLRFRLGTPAGFGPRIDVELPELRSAAVHDLDGDGRADVVGISKVSGRMTTWSLERDADARSQLARYSLRAIEGSDPDERTFTVGDVDGDGTDDVVAAEPGTATLTIFRGGRALSRSSHPSLVGVADPRIGDVDGDGRPELVCRSDAERMLGVTRFDEGRLPFPETIGVDGEPVALDLCDIDGDGLDDAVAAIEKGAGRRREISLAIWLGSAEGLVDEPRVEPLPDLRKAPDALLAADLVRTDDALADVMLFTPGESEVPTLVFRHEGGWSVDPRGEDTPGFGILAGVGPEALGFDDLDGDGHDELLVGSANFARAMTFELTDEGLHPRVLDQIASPSIDARVEGCALLETPDGPPSIVLRDRTARELHVLVRDGDGPPRLADRVQAGRIDFAGLVPADVDGDGRQDLVVLGRSQFGVLAPEADRSTFRELSSYDPEREHTFLDQLAFGDLNADGEPDVVASESQKHALVLLTARAGQLDRALAFPLYESSALAQGAEREPREVLCRDCNGDGKDDLAVLVHDKLIVYVQE